MNDRVDLLAPIRELLADKARWCRGAYARDCTDETVSLLDPRACKWCLAGAVYITYGPGSVAVEKVSAELLRRLEPSKGIAVFNDSPETTHADILALLEEPFYEEANE